MDATVLLCDSTICRLCAEETDNGTRLFPLEENKENLSELVNKYLPLKVEKDGKFPCSLCPGCTIQLEATKSFFDLIIEGQKKLRELFAHQQETLRRQEKQKEQLENALKIVNPNSSVQTYTVQTDEAGEKFFIQILAEGPLFPPEHEIALKSEGLEKPKKKRGRPPKPAPGTEPEAQINLEELKPPEEEIEYDADGRRKRRIKKPSRYSELLQGKELDRIFKEEGVLDEDDILSENDLFLNGGKLDGSSGVTNEVIGHMQGKDGEDLGQLVILNKNSSKNRIKCKVEIGKRKEKKYECEYCGRVFLHQGRLEIHKSFHKNIRYQCGITECNLDFETKTSLDKHQADTGHSGTTLVESLENYGQVELSQDSNVMKDLPEEKEILPDKQEESIITCSLCDKTFTSKQNYETHVKAIHENQKLYSCNKCEKKFSYMNRLKSHLLQHVEPSEKNYSCDSCEKVFSHPSSLVYHREAEHNNGRKFVCNKCKKTFKHKQLLLRHQLVHTNERPHTCESCGASFKTKWNLLNHMPMHTGEKKFFCVQCGQSFAHKTSLTLHVRWHNGQKPYKCDVCLKSFSQKGNLAEHRRIHTGEKPYCCTFCGRKFTTSSQFKLHVKRHTGEKPWKCEFCTKTFLHKETWKSHTRRHNNERPYQCQHCLRGFSELWALKKHIRLHTGEKPYACDLCYKSFSDSSNLTKHKKIHCKNKNKEKPKVETPTTKADASQILYLTYQDGNSNEEQGQTLVHIVDEATNVASEKLPSTIFSEDILPAENPDEISSVDVQLQQLVDNEGTPISLIADGHHMKVVSTMIDDEQCIQGLLPDGTLVPINLTMQDGKPIAAELIIKENTEKKHEGGLTEAIDVLDDNIQLLTGDQQDIDSEKIENKIQFLTEDGQNVCFITTYDIGNSTLGNQYI